jgi:hypothetical protein
MENKNDRFDESGLTEFSRKILLGMRNANQKLVEKSATLGGSLVISENAEVKRVPAKDLLSKLNDDEKICY